MFERRLKIILCVIALIAFAIVLRAGQVQILQRDAWTQRALETMKRSQLIETLRGRIVDFRGRPVAVDSPCIDACVDFRAIAAEPDAVWVAAIALKRSQALPEYNAAKNDQRKRLRDQEAASVRNDLQGMWQKLAQISGKPIEEINDTRAAIVSKVEMRRRYIAYRNYEKARQQHETQKAEAPESSWRRWLLGETQDAPELDDFTVTVAEENEAHIILRNVGAEAQVELGKHLERYPGLLLRASTFRYYPYANAGCHLIGRLSRVDREDLKNDPNMGVDELRQYLPNDLIGRSGIESLAEPMLRGSRGRIEREGGKDVSSDAYAAGNDVRLTIDIELQQEIQKMFAGVPIRDPKTQAVLETIPMHGAAVVIDIASGGVRALASYPDYDPNQFDTLFPYLSDVNNLDTPLLNRATQSQLEPGSTVKPMVGLAAISKGLITPTDGIECTGYLMINGRPQRNGRCWVASKFHDTLCRPDCPLKYRGCPTVSHHPIGGGVPHPTGFLTYPDALERSCNVYFETLADKIGLEGLSDWYGRFGLGRPTGIGISESVGRLPNSYVGSQRSFATWSAGIGQGPVAATPLQMANVVATIAREGIWERPSLIEGMPPSQAIIDKLGPARVNLNLPLDALRAAREGMIRVVNSPSGTGTGVRRSDVTLACKTGTAQAAALSIILRDDKGKPLLDDNGRNRREFLELSTMEHPNPRVPWYRGTGAENKERNHAWFVGFAPAQNPKIAFAVMIEYGGSGGGAAGGIAKGVIEACVEHGYLPLDWQVPAATQPTAQADNELMHEIGR